MRIALATDAWRPQVNGVVTTLTATAANLRWRGHEVRIIHPSECSLHRLPELSGDPPGRVAARLRGA